MSKKTDLGYYWVANFTNKPKKVEQFDKDDNEVLFGVVLDRMNELESFEVTDGNKGYIVDLVKKEIKTSKQKWTLTGVNPELIYFRRNSVRVDTIKGTALTPSVVHHVGLKTSTKEMKFELFHGQGMKPKKDEHINVKTGAKKDITND